jgi:hypothetical protein
LADWFEPKKYGYGAGRPIAWQGWAIIFAYILLIFGSALLFVPMKPILFFAIIIPATLALLIICARTTRGAWRWRWGSEE